MEGPNCSRPTTAAAAASPFYTAAVILTLLLSLYFYSFGLPLPRDLSGIPKPNPNPNPCVGVSVSELCAEESPYLLLLTVASRIPLSHYALAFLMGVVVFLYNFLEFHFFHDLFTGFRGDPVRLTFHPQSELYESVVSKCRILHDRYLTTPWLSSPHIQTAFLGYIGGHPEISYEREVLHTRDEGTLALDWLRNTDVTESCPVKDDRTPIVMVIPGITSDSASPYVKHLAFKVSKRGWHVCVVNHRGFGGVPITSDCFHNGGWTEDVRQVADHILTAYPEAPLYAVGVSVGANILVKYLGEDGHNVPVVGAAAVCSPWDNLLVDRFLNHRYLQKLYNKAITSSLKRFAERHSPVFSRLADMEGIKKSCFLREFDCYATAPLGQYKTVDTYYRRSSSVNFVESIAVPLLSIGASDDPVCPVEAIPWDECRANANIILATTTHGGHVAYYEGITANSLWWVRAVDEFLGVLDAS